MRKQLVLMSSKENTTNTLSTLSVFSSFTQQILAKHHYAKIHSVFPNGFNLNFSGELVYMSAHQEGMLSGRGLSINHEVFDAIHPHLDVGFHVRVRKDQLLFYTRPHIFTIRLTEKRVKDLKIVPVPEEKWDLQGFKKRLEALALFEQTGFSTNDRLRETLEDILETKEVRVDHVNRLIGGGVGLTPTGDDFLQGLICMEQTFAHLPHIQSIVQKRLKERSTTDVSLSYYEALFAGYSNEPLVLLFQAVRAQDDKQFEQAISYIQNYGETSGYDLLMGMYTYLQIL